MNTKLIDCYVTGLRLTLRGLVKGKMTSINIENITQSPIDITKNVSCFNNFPYSLFF